VGCSTCKDVVIHTLSLGTVQLSSVTVPSLMLSWYVPSLTALTLPDRHATMPTLDALHGQVFNNSWVNMALDPAPPPQKKAHPYKIGTKRYTLLCEFGELQEIRLRFVVFVTKLFILLRIYYEFPKLAFCLYFVHGPPTFLCRSTPMVECPHAEKEAKMSLG